MAKEGTLLVVDDNRSILAALQLLMGNYFARVLTLPTPNRLATLLREEPIDVVLLDMNFTAGINTGNEGIYWLREIHRTRPDVKVVLFTAYADIDLAVRAMRDGAVDFVVKPWDNERLVAALRNAYNLARSQREVKQLKEIKRELKQEEPMFWGGSPAMARIREIVEKVAATDANILITGENGTGKEMLAREIHNRSARRRELMVPVDMGAVPETLFESELFGHVKGAFTDARTDRAGKFEVADRGTLFLDEIGNLPPRLQSKLLTAIQSGRIVRLGSNTPVKVDIRLISATNRDLFGMVADGEFREDLLYRINTIHIDLPPLRQRREDILPLAEKFLGRYAAKYNKPIEGFDEAAVREMHDYPWAGNIRELQHTVEKAVILCDGRTIAPATLLLRPATNRDLFGMVADGEFREDLLYRINTIHIDLPPLRQRREDILPLAEKFLGRYAAKYNKPIEGFDEAAVREMHDYPWAGNIRELQHTVEKAVILCDGRTIAPATLLLRPAPAETSPKTGFSTLEEMERAMIAEAVARCGGNLTEVARQLGITRQTLYNKIKRYGL